MAAMKARRPGRGPEHRRGRRAGAPSDNVPRLAAIKLSGGLGPSDIQVSGKSLALVLAGAVLICGAAIAGAAWMGSSLFDAREAFARAADSAAADAGFAIDEIEVAGVSGARAEEIRAVVMPDGRRSILSLDPADVKARVEGLDWVASAKVRRLWPSTMHVDVVRRQAFARWREGGQVAVIDANGAPVLTERAADHPELPLLEGAGAGPAAEPLLMALEQLPALRARLKSLVFVRERRWNVELKNGAIIALPEGAPAIALARLEGLQESHRLLDRPLASIDMRAPGRLAVRIRARADQSGAA